MFKILRRDIFNIKLPGIPITKVIKPSPDLLAATRYVYVY